MTKNAIAQEEKKVEPENYYRGGRPKENMSHEKNSSRRCAKELANVNPGTADDKGTPKRSIEHRKTARKMKNEQQGNKQGAVKSAYIN